MKPFNRLVVVLGQPPSCETAWPFSYISVDNRENEGQDGSIYMVVVDDCQRPSGKGVSYAIAEMYRRRLAVPDEA